MYIFGPIKGCANSVTCQEICKRENETDSKETINSESKN